MLIYSLGACLNVYRGDVLIDQWSGVMFASLILSLMVQFYLHHFVGEDDESNCEFYLFVAFFITIE
jgi:hypothetical protein